MRPNSRIRGFCIRCDGMSQKTVRAETVADDDDRRFDPGPSERRQAASWDSASHSMVQGKESTIRLSALKLIDQNTVAHHASNRFGSQLRSLCSGHRHQFAPDKRSASTPATLNVSIPYGDLPACAGQ
jgi:hypothetical protein